MNKARYYVVNKGVVGNPGGLSIHICGKGYATKALQSFGLISKRPLKKGDRVKIRNMRGSLINAANGQTHAVVNAVHYGKPTSLELPNGKIIEVFGLIIELLPLLEKLWVLLKDIFKKR